MLEYCVSPRKRTALSTNTYRLGHLDLILREFLETELLPNTRSLDISIVYLKEANAYGQTKQTALRMVELLVSQTTQCMFPLNQTE
jgi:hypothetical protein